MSYEIKSNAILYYGMDSSMPNKITIETELDGEINRSLMEESINIAIKRYPYFAVKLAELSDKLILEENNQHISLNDCDDETSFNDDYLFHFSVKGNILKVVYEHALTDVHGFMPFLKTILAQYYATKEGINYSPVLIHTPDSSVSDKEFTEPLGLLKNDIQPNKPTAPTFKSFMLPEDNGDYTRTYSYPVSMRNKDMKELVSKMGGSFTSTISAMMARAIKKVHEVSAGESIVCTNIIDRKSVLGCPESHYLSMHPAHFPLDNDLLSKPLNEIVTAVRSDLHNKMKTDVFGMALQMKQLIDYLLSIPSVEQKKQMCHHIINQQQNVSTFTVSYVGLIDFDTLNYKISNIRINAAAKPMLIEACAHGDVFDINILQTFESDVYRNAFIQVLRENGIEISE